MKAKTKPNKARQEKPQYIEKDGTRHSWRPGKPIPEGWTLHDGPIPGPEDEQ